MRVGWNLLLEKMMLYPKILSKSYVSMDVWTDFLERLVHYSVWGYALPRGTHEIEKLQCEAQTVATLS